MFLSAIKKKRKEKEKSAMGRLVCLWVGAWPTQGPWLVLPVCVSVFIYCAEMTTSFESVKLGCCECGRWFRSATVSSSFIILETFVQV